LKGKLSKAKHNFIQGRFLKLQKNPAIQCQAKCLFAFPLSHNLMENVLDYPQEEHFLHGFACLD